MASGFSIGGRGDAHLVEDAHLNPKYRAMYRGEILKDLLAPIIVTPNLKSETGEYLRPEAGNIVMKIIAKPPGSFSRLDSGLYTTESIQKIINWNGVNTPYAPSISELYKPLIDYNELQFMGNTRVFGITTVKGFSDYQREIPSVSVPVILKGRLEINYGSSKDSALKIKSDTFLAGDEFETLTSHVRLEVFLILTPGFGFKILITQFYDIHTYFKSEKGAKFLKGLKSVKQPGFKDGECGYVKLGYHFDDRPHKRVVEHGFNGDKYLQKFIFKPQDWRFYTKALTEFCGVPLATLEASIRKRPLRRTTRTRLAPFDIYKPWYSVQFR